MANICIKRGLESNRTGLLLKSGELILATDTNRLYFGDGTANGGIPITASYADIAKTASYVTLSGTNVMSSSAQLKYGLYGQDLVLGNITASNVQIQSLSVQNITSSVVYSSGSNVFGNNQSNTQSFTGSVFVTGSLFLDGRICIGTTASNAMVTIKSDTMWHPLYVRDYLNNIICRLSYNGQIILRPNNTVDTVSINPSGSSFFNGGSFGIGTATPGTGSILSVVGLPTSSTNLIAGEFYTYFDGVRKIVCVV